MKKIFYKLIVLLIATVTLTGCSSLSKADKKEQKELISNFLEAFYKYDYEEENSECSEEINELCQNILNNLSPYLSSNTAIDYRVVNALVIQPANFSKVSIDYVTHSLEKEKLYETENGDIYSFITAPEVKIKSSINQKEVVKIPTTIAINLVKEDGHWKVRGIDYMSDDYLFYVDSLFY